MNLAMILGVRNIADVNSRICTRMARFSRLFPAEIQKLAPGKTALAAQRQRYGTMKIFCEYGSFALLPEG